MYSLSVLNGNSVVNGEHAATWKGMSYHLNESTADTSRIKPSLIRVFLTQHSPLSSLFAPRGKLLWQKCPSLETAGVHKNKTKYCSAMWDAFLQCQKCLYELLPGHIQICIEMNVLYLNSHYVTIFYNSNVIIIAIDQA